MKDSDVYFAPYPGDGKPGLRVAVVGNASADMVYVWIGTPDNKKTGRIGRCLGALDARTAVALARAILKRTKK